MTLLADDIDTAQHEPVVATERLLWAGPLTVATSIAAVHVVRLAIRLAPGVQRDSLTLGWIAPTADTAILVTLGVIVFAALSASADDPIRIYRRVAFSALLISFLPLILMGRGSLIGGAPTALALAALHAAAYVPCVTLLPRLLTVSPAVEEERT
jgi:hypothetical protein